LRETTRLSPEGIELRINNWASRGKLDEILAFYKDMYGKRDGGAGRAVMKTTDNRKVLDNPLVKKMGWNNRDVEMFLDDVLELSALVNKKSGLDLGPHDFYIVAYPGEWTFMTGRMGERIITMSLI
jgi:hypothetical protein